MLLCSGYLHTWRNTPTDLLYCVGYRLWVIIDLLNIICQCHMFNKLWNYALLSSSVSRDLASLFSISDIQFLLHPVFDLCFPLVLSLSVSVSMVLLSVPPSLLSSCPTLTLMVFNKSFHPQPAQNFSICHHFYPWYPHPFFSKTTFPLFQAPFMLLFIVHDSHPDVNSLTNVSNTC